MSGDFFCWSILNFGGVYIPMQPLKRFERRYLHLPCKRWVFFARLNFFSTQRKGWMYEARCRLKFVAKCRLVSSFFFHFYGARCDGRLLTTFKDVETGMYFRIWLVCWHWFWKNIYSDVRCSTLIPSDPTLFSFQSNRCFFLVSVVDVASPHPGGEKSSGKYVLTVDQKERTTFERVWSKRRGERKWSIRNCLYTDINI